jgi:hypothetical protein
MLLPSTNLATDRRTVAVTDFNAEQATNIELLTGVANQMALRCHILSTWSLTWLRNPTYPTIQRSVFHWLRHFLYDSITTKWKS